MEIDVEGEIIPTLTVPRGTESTHHTQHVSLTTDLPSKLNIEDMNSIRLQIEEQLSKWTEVRRPYVNLRKLYFFSYYYRYHLQKKRRKRGKKYQR